MFGLILSDFYKMFHRKAFYICLLISVVLSALIVYVTPMMLKMQFNMPDMDLDLRMFGYSGLYVLFQAIANVLLPMVIFTSLFTANDFSTGAVKTVLVRGVSRISMYISKIITVFFTSIIFNVLSCGANFAVGCYLWGVGTYDQAAILNQLKGVGLYILVSWAIYSLVTMIAFLVRSTGGTVSCSLILVVLPVPAYLFYFVSYIIKQWFNYDIDLVQYWIGNCLIEPQNVVSQATIMKILPIALVYIVITNLIGLISFSKREVK